MPIQNSKYPRLWQLTVHWMQGNTPVKREIIVGATNKEEAIEIAKVRTADGYATIHVKDMGKLRTPLTYFSSDIILDSQQNNKTQSLFENTITRLAVLWGQATVQAIINNEQSSTVVSKLTNQTAQIEQIHKWAAEYLHISSIDIDLFFQGKLQQYLYGKETSFAEKLHPNARKITIIEEPWSEPETVILPNDTSSTRQVTKPEFDKKDKPAPEKQVNSDIASEQLNEKSTETISPQTEAQPTTADENPVEQPEQEIIVQENTVLLDGDVMNLPVQINPEQSENTPPSEDTEKLNGQQSEQKSHSDETPETDDQPNQEELDNTQDNRQDETPEEIIDEEVPDDDTPMDNEVDENQEPSEKPPTVRQHILKNEVNTKRALLKKRNLMIDAISKLPQPLLKTILTELTSTLTYRNEQGREITLRGQAHTLFRNYFLPTIHYKDEAALCAQIAQYIAQYCDDKNNMPALDFVYHHYYRQEDI